MVSNRLRITRFLDEHGPHSVADISRCLRIERSYLVGELTQMERVAIATYSPDNDKFSLTEEVIMKRRKEREASSTGGASVGNLAAQRDKIILEFSGPHALMETAVQNDPVLHERLQVAIADGMPAVDLTGTPMHRRADAVEAALDSWHELTKNGPCSACGTRTARQGLQPTGYLDADTAPQFHVKTSGPSPLCDWCADFLSQRNVAELREVIFNAVAGTTGMAGFSPRSHPTLVPMAHEVGEYGTPWGHLTAVHRRAIEMRAEQVVHPSRYVRTPGAAQRISVPGISTPVHTYETIPHPSVKFADLGRASKVAKQNQEQYEALRQKRAKDDADWESYCAGLVKRDERLEQMEPDERERYLQQQAPLQRRWRA